MDYVLDEFDGLVPLHRILYQLHVAGYRDMTIIDIRECLLLYGRIKSLNEPIVPARGQPAQSAVPTFIIRPNISDDTRTQEPLTSNPAVDLPAPHWISQAQQASSSGWDAAADDFAKSAHTQGQTALQITESLYSNGFSTSVSQVVTSLTRQAVSNGLR